MLKKSLDKSFSYINFIEFYSKLSTAIFNVETPNSLTFDKLQSSFYNILSKKGLFNSNIFSNLINKNLTRFEKTLWPICQECTTEIDLDCECQKLHSDLFVEIIEEIICDFETSKRERKLCLKILDEFAKEELWNDLQTDFEEYIKNDILLEKLRDNFLEYQAKFKITIDNSKVEIIFEKEKKRSLLNLRETPTFEEYWKIKEEARKLKAESEKTKDIKPKEDNVDKKTDPKLNKIEESKPKADKKQLRIGGDRHKYAREVRYREEKLVEYSKTCNLKIVKNPNLDKNHKNFHIRIDLWNKSAHQNLWWTHFFTNHNIIKKSFFFSFDSGAGTWLGEREWLIIAMIKQRRKLLIEAIQSENPFKFKKLLEEIVFDVDWTIKWLKINPHNIIETRNKIAQHKGYNENTYKQLQKASVLLSRNGEFSIKTMVNHLVVLDSDAHKKNPELRKEIEHALEMMMNFLRINTYGLSKNGGWHIFFRCLEAIGSFKVFYKSFTNEERCTQFGDLQASKTYVVAPLSKNRKLVKRGKKWRKKSISHEIYTFRTKAKMIEVFAKFGFHLSYSEEVQNWQNYKKYKDSLALSEKIVDNYEKSSVDYKEFKEYKVKPYKSNSSEKNYKDFVKKNIEITNIEVLKEDSEVNKNNSTESRESGYCKVSFRDEEQNSGVFLIDEKRRKTEAKIITERFINFKNVNLILTKTDQYECFLLKGAN